MRNILAICGKDIRSYFTSFIGYGVMTVFLIIAGYFFFSLISFFSLYSFQTMQNPYMQQGLNLTEAIAGPLLMNISVIMLFMMPMLTMRCLAEEKKSSTVELLFTYPIRDIEILLGKYLAIVFVFVIMLAPIVLYPVLIHLVGGVIALKTFATGLLGLVLMGMSFLALGLFASSVTENQIVAVSLSFGALLLFWVVGWTSSFVPKQVAEFLTNLSIIEHYQNFAQGLIDTQDILFYGLFIFFFLFLTLRILESRNWRG